ncbi:MAG: aspartate aminotransferase family protein [Microbacteriaceae bacterium]|nr:aspartate aminotransferase family protein [Microbacteriaceae bacterium]
MPGPDTKLSNDLSNELPGATGKLVARSNRSLGTAKPLSFEAPVEIVRGSGTLLFDADGTEYLDVYSVLPTVGHSHPRVVEAIAAQTALSDPPPGFLNRAVIEYSEALLGTLPAGLDNVLYANSGSEANDLALRIAKASTGRSGIIVTRNANHGGTTETAAISPALGGAARLAPWVRLVDAPVGDGSAFAHDVAAAAAELQDSTHGFAALIADSIFASDGVQPGAPGFLFPVLDAVHSAGGLYIADETQAGLGRVGTGLWGFERHDDGDRRFVPDIVTLGQSMANGLPVGAVIAGRDLVNDFTASGNQLTDAGGSPVVIAAASAVLDVVRDERLIEGASVVGGYIQAGLAMLAEFHSLIGTVRGSGLVIGIDIVRNGAPDQAQAVAIVNELRRRHVLLAVTGPHNNTLTVRPSLTFGTADAERFLTELDSAIRATRIRDAA